MVYRRTPAVVVRLEDNRARILKAARDLVAEGGWRHAQVAAVAAKAGVGHRHGLPLLPLEGGPVRGGAGQRLAAASVT